MADLEQDTPEPTPPPLLRLREPLPPVTDTPDALKRVVEAFAAGTGPVAIDAERASGYRYSQRAYLIQLRREGAGTALVDPVAFEDLSLLDEALADTEWILHAATQDLRCLTEVGLNPRKLFDTELAGRLLGYPRVGLASLVEALLGQSLAKEHSAVDWSKRPLPEPWLEYAALDVEVLVEIRGQLAEALEATGKIAWAEQEFDALLSFTGPATRTDPWRRTSGMHKVRGRRGAAVVRELWETRDEIAEQRDIAAGRIIPDASIVVAAQSLPKSRRDLQSLKAFRGRGAERYADDWIAAIQRALALPENELPPTSASYDGPPPARTWKDRNPAAAARLSAARTALAELAERVDTPVENLLTPDLLRRLLWEPPEISPDLAQEVAQRLLDSGARLWQVELTTPIISATIRDANGEE
jgi:ribonuclease D